MESKIEESLHIVCTSFLARFNSELTRNILEATEFTEKYADKKETYFDDFVDVLSMAKSVAKRVEEFISSTGVGVKKWESSVLGKTFLHDIRAILLIHEGIHWECVLHDSIFKEEHAFTTFRGTVEEIESALSSMEMCMKYIDFFMRNLS